MKIFSMLTVGLAFAGGQQTQNTAVGKSSHKNLEQRLEKLSNEFSDCFKGLIQDGAVVNNGYICTNQACIETIRYKSTEKMDTHIFFETDQWKKISSLDQLSLLKTAVYSCLEARESLKTDTPDMIEFATILRSIGKPLFESVELPFPEFD